jgi:hypothetical protein
MQRDMSAVEDAPGCRQQLVAPQHPVELSLDLADDRFPPLGRHQQIPFTPRQRQTKRRQPRLPRQLDPGKPGIGQGQAVGVLTGDPMDDIGIGFGGRIGRLQVVGHSGAPELQAAPNMRAVGP